MKNAVEVMETIRNHGKSVADDSKKKIGSLAVGDYVAQGDVNIWRLEGVPGGAVQEKKPDSQLAPGTTKGSRHTVRESDMAHCEFFRLPEENEIQGPVIKMNEPTTIEHPEHGDQLWPAGVVLITYQRLRSDELKRARD